MLGMFNELPEIIEYDKKSAVVLGDCVSVLKNIKSESVDLIFADPPYNIGKEFEKNKMSKQEYIEWCKVWIDECLRILKNTGSFYLMSATQYMSYLDCYLDEKAIIKSRIVWCYDSSGAQAKRHFGSLYEPILMVVKDENNYTFNSDAIMIETKMGAEKRLIDYRKQKPAPYNAYKVPGNVWRIPRVRYKMDEYEDHPSQKSMKLLEMIIKASSNPDDVVLDPFGGTFTTNFVAKRLNRFSIGIELLEKYFKIGLRRLGIAKEYKGEKLEKVKVKKTKNKSKKMHEIDWMFESNKMTKSKKLTDFF